MEITIQQAFAVGRAIELARNGEEETAIYVLERDWPELLEESKVLATNIEVIFEENVDYILECMCTDELGIQINEEEEQYGENEECEGVTKPSDTLEQEEKVPEPVNT